jgi:sugar lactone lactonase YvrE
MTRFKIGAAVLGLMIGVLASAPANAWKRGSVEVLAVVPGNHVEGLTVGPDGNIYVSTFGFNTPSEPPGPARLFVFSPNGKLLRNVPIENSSPHTLGLGFSPVGTHDLLVIDFGAHTVLKVDPNTGHSNVFMTAPAGSGLNALTFDTAGNVYVSDSFSGKIWKTDSGGSGLTAWSSDPLLGNGGGTLTPPFGANGIEFNNAGTVMYVANTAFHQIIQIPVTNGNAGTASIFITGINAPDGIAIDRADNLWICANQEDEIVVIDTTGKVIAKLGDFRGIDPSGFPRGLLFPASLAFSNDRSTLYVSNLTLFLPNAGAQAAIDSDWTLEVKGSTVSKLHAKIPPFPDDDEQ